MAAAASATVKGSRSFPPSTAARMASMIVMRFSTPVGLSDTISVASMDRATPDPALLFQSVTPGTRIGNEAKGGTPLPFFGRGFPPLGSLFPVSGDDPVPPFHPSISETVRIGAEREASYIGGMSPRG